MAGSETTDLQRLVVSLEANIKKYENELQRARSVTEGASRDLENRFARMNSNVANSFVRGVGAGTREIIKLREVLAVIAVGALTEFAKKAVEAGDNIAKSAEKIGITTDSLQELRYAAQLSGVSAEQLDAVMLQLTKRLSGAQDDVDDVARALGRLGINVKDLKGQKADDIFKLVADRLRSIPDQMQQAQIATQLFGKAGQQLLPLLRSGSDGIAKLALEAHKYGLVLSQETLEKASKANDEFDKLGIAAKVAGINIAVGLLPTLEKIREVMTDPQFQAGVQNVARGFGDFIEFLAKHKDEIAALGAAFVGMRVGGAAGAAFGPTGAAVGAAVGALGGFVVAVQKLGEAQLQADESAKKFNAEIEKTGMVALTSSNAVARAISDELIKLGMGANQIAAVLAAVKRESNFSPTATGDNGTSFGLFQVHADRLEQLKAFAAQAGTSINDVSAQIAFFIKELDEGEKKAGDMLRAAGNPEEAARAMAVFERFKGFNDENSKEFQARLAQTKAYVAALGQIADTTLKLTVSKPAAIVDPDVGKALEDIAFKTRLAAGDFRVLATGFPEMVHGFQLSKAAIDNFGGSVTTLSPQLQQLNAAMENFARAQELATAAKDFGKAFGTAFEQAIIYGKSLQDVMKGLIQEIERVILRLLVTGPLERFLTSTFLGAFGGLISHASGGPVSPGRAYLVGERGPEVMVPSASGTIVPNGALPRMGGSIVVAPVFNVDARGADMAAVVRIQRGLDDVVRTLPKTVTSIMHTQQVRRVMP